MATRRETDILSSLGCPSYVVSEVRIGEVLELRDLAPDGTIGDLIRVDTEGLVNSGLLQEVSVEPNEEAAFVDFATEMDDGEACSAAVCVHRGLWLVTDDRVCLRAARNYQPPIPTITTPEVIKRWVDTDSVDADSLGEAIKRIETCARYRPGRTHPLLKWWESNRTIE
jgi:hypothetical protein